MAKGKVFIVGAGPGDPYLLTLKAKDLLLKADVVVYDALIHPRILGLIPLAAKKIFRGKRGKIGALSQAQINGLLVKLAQKGKKVVRLKGGDPFVFGRGAEEAFYLREHGVDFEIVPGVTSAIAVPAYAGIPVTYRAINSSFTVVTGHEDPTKKEAQIDWQSLAQNNGTLVFLMGLHTLQGVCGRLMDEGKAADTPVAVIEAGTTAQQRTVTGTLETIAVLTEKAGLRPPATVVIGKVVELRNQLRWIDRKPLFGRRILVTRTRSQASILSDALSDQGAEVVEIPTIEINPLPLTPASHKWLKNLDQYDWLIFTSGTAVFNFISRLDELKIEVRHMGRAKIACVGQSTADNLRGFGIKSDLIPKDYKQEGLIKAFQKVSLKDKKVLFLRAKEGRNILVDYLKKKGARVDLCPLYENRIPKGLGERVRRLFSEEGGVDLLTFASSSSADNFYGLFTGTQRGKWLKTIPVAVIGPVTASSIRKWGGKAVIQPRKYTIPGLVSAILKWAQKHHAIKQ